MGTAHLALFAHWIRGAMNTLLQDIRIAIRMMLKNPGFSLVVVLTLGLGIGANTAIFSVVNAVLLRPLGYKDSGSLVNIWGKLENQGIPRLWVSEPEYWDLRDRNESFSELGAYSLGNGANLTSNDSPPMQVSAPAATATLFQILGVQTALGRTFTADEDQPGHDHEALLSFALWKSLFGGDPQIVGKSYSLTASRMPSSECSARISHWEANKTCGFRSASTGQSRRIAALTTCV